MPINAGFEYAKANDEYLKASTTEEKIKALKLLITTAPKHKGSEKLLQQLKRRLADLKKEQIKEKKAGKKKSFAIKKEGAATVVFIGVLNSGKTKLFCSLTGNNYEGENNYQIKMRMIPFENVWLQAIDVPAFYAGFSESGNAGQVFGLIRNSDVIVLVAGDEEQLVFLQTILGNAKIKVGKEKRQDFESTELPVVATLSDAEDLQQLKEEFWQKTGKIRVQTKTAGKIAPKPVVLKKGATVKDLAWTIHQDFVRKFKSAKIWGKSALFSGQSVGLGHKLKDKDIVEIFTK